MLNVPPGFTAADADFSRAVGFVNGEFGKLEDARISVRDFGLTHADMTYDVLHVWKRRYFRLEDHLDRFEASMKGFRLQSPYDRATIVAIMNESMGRLGLDEALIYFACTRGVAPLGSRDMRKAKPSFFMTTSPLVLRGSRAEMQRGLHMHVAETVKRIPADSVNPVWKNVHWGDLTRAQHEAWDRGRDAVVLPGHDGFLTEGIGYNVMAVIDGRIVTPDSGALEGVSAKTMLELAAMLGVPATRGKITAEQLRNADEAFITSTSCGLFPVTRIDDRHVSNGAPGPVTTKLLNLYYERKDAGWHGTQVDYAARFTPRG
jgi:branched-chain amino acid aminotransferase